LIKINEIAKLIIKLKYIYYFKFKAINMHKAIQTLNIHHNVCPYLNNSIKLSNYHAHIID